MKQESKGRRERTEKREQPQIAAAGNGLRPLWLCAFSGLCVAIPVLPTETVLLGGSVYLWMLFGWVLLGAWTLTGAATRQLKVRMSPAMPVLGGLLAWHSISALVMAGQGNPRTSTNMMWLWISLGTIYFLARQLVVTGQERRAVMSILIASCVCLSVVGYYQYLYEFPKTRLDYERDPDKALQQAGVFAPPGSTPRRHFEDRLRSKEPFATFALTNSLAGFLAPWLIVVGGILLTNWNTAPQSMKTKVGGVAASLLILGCLVLTKSRTAWLAVMLGFGLLGVYGRRAGWRPDWRLLIGIGAAVVLLSSLAAWMGGLDWLVVLESSKSLSYRLQYWQGAAALIRDYPWFGCGPGNFQQYYTAYKLPEASETIAEPHNFLLEVWATAGTPAAILFLAGLAGTVWTFRRRAAGTAVKHLVATRGAEGTATGSPRAVYIGSCVGLLAAVVACGGLEGYFPSASLLLIGAPVAFGVLVLLNDWVCEGQLPSAVTTIAVIVMLVNLLAAGGIGFAGVAVSLWILIALQTNEVTDELTNERADATCRLIILGRRSAIAIAVLLVGLVACFYQTGYAPVTTAASWIQEGNSHLGLGQPIPAWDAYRQAAAADTRAPEPWEQICDLAAQAWLQTGERAYEHEFQVAARELLARNPRSSMSYLAVGHRWLAAYRRFGVRQHLDAAIESYGIAVKLYPNYNLGHAQLAWALYLAGDESASAEAGEALRLDNRTPHSEMKLSQQELTDTEPADKGQPPSAAGRSAEQVLLSLRTLHKS